MKDTIAKTAGPIGYSVGALQELSTMLRHECKPVIFLINNGGYTIERGYLGKSETYNDVARWAYADLPRVFRPDTNARSFVVNTVDDLEKALSAPNDTLPLASTGPPRWRNSSR